MGMPAWVVWVVAAAALGVAEVLTLTLLLGMLAVAALIAALVALLGADVVWQILAFALGSLGLLTVVRPVARRHLRNPQELRSGTAALVGSSAVVLERVDRAGGRVKLAGETWSARAYDEGSVIEPGAHVEVLQIQGATAVVLESESSWTG
jgi:membrane protein implicated in regulation of membrane protease activity